MNYGRLFAQSWHLIRRNKFLWLLGLIAGLGSVILAPLRAAFSPQIAQLINDPSGLDLALLTAESDRLMAWLLGGTAVLFVVSLIYWLAVTVAQGAIIGATIDLAAGRPSSWRSSLRQGIGYLGRFIAIDTLVYFPLFALTLALMLLTLGGLTVIAYEAIQGSAAESVAVMMAAGLVCLLPLAALLSLVGLGTSVFRTLAFRDTAVHKTGVRDSIRHTWQVIRQQWGTTLVLLALLWGVQMAAGLLVSVVTIPLGWATAVTTAVMPDWAGNWLWLASAAAAAPLAIVHAFVAVGWTLGYMAMAEVESAE